MAKACLLSNKYITSICFNKSMHDSMDNMYNNSIFTLPHVIIIVMNAEMYIIQPSLSSVNK